MNRSFDPVAFAQEHLPKLMKLVTERAFQWNELPPDPEHPEHRLHAFQGISPNYTIVVGQGNTEDRGVVTEGAATYLPGFVFFHLPPELTVEIYKAATAAMN